MKRLIPEKFKRLATISYPLLAITFLALSACATVDVDKLPQSANASDEIIKLEKERNDAAAKQVDALSPNNFANADKYLDKAKAKRDSNDDNKDILEYVELSRGWLKKANQSAVVSQSVLPGVVVARQKALAADAYNQVQKDFKKADDELESVTEDIEDNDTASAEKRRGPLERQYAEVEMAAILEAQIGHAGRQIETAKDEGAKKFAPKTLAVAEQKYKDAKARIEADMYNKNVLKAAHLDATTNGDRVLKITRAAKAAGGPNAEDIALAQEASDLKVAQAQGQVQSEKEAAAARAAADKAALDISAGEVAKREAALAALAASNAGLESESAFNARFEKARTVFTKDEAEVYKDGRRLVIRLKGLEFPSGKTEIQPQNFALLQKVKVVLKDFGQSHVIIEGHTDSVGGKTKNAKLSSERAEAVESYLVANQAVDGSKVDAVGFGYEKPLATNKTKEGRAKNRRVDLILDPETVPAGTPPSN